MAKNDLKTKVKKKKNSMNVYNRLVLTPQNYVI